MSEEHEKILGIVPSNDIIVGRVHVAYECKNPECNTGIYIDGGTRSVNLKDYEDKQVILVILQDVETIDDADERERLIDKLKEELE